jgi:probable rRNA maturation factor
MRRRPASRGADNERGRPRLVLALQYAAPRGGLPARASIARWLRAALGGGRARVAVRFVGGAEGRRLNREYRGPAQATNVLTFGYGNAHDGALAGDIVLCVPVIAREARAQAKPLRAHYAHLTVHGLLHLLGYEHERPRDAARMEGEERRILARLGFGDPYRGGKGEEGRRKSSAAGTR